MSNFFFTISGNSNKVTSFRPTVPASCALYMHKLRTWEEPLGEILAITLTNSGDVVLLTDNEKKVKKTVSDTRLKLFSNTRNSLNYTVHKYS